MGDTERPSELVQRLHRLRVERGLTIQEMAEKCDLPKSSLESYMRTEGARRPGVEALVAIGNGMDVSIDWLVGRTDKRPVSDSDRRRYALAVYDIVLGLLREIEHRETSVVKNGLVDGRPVESFAAKMMLHFVAKTGLFPADDEGTFFNLDTIVQAVGDRETEKE
ncbi:MAG: helix-turn-helix transcriptional regulator [Pseudorhodobacter sp.]|nr:helix-turn-helix transcriptional regulator [Pseudorhodobacter sp.]